MSNDCGDLGTTVIPSDQLGSNQLLAITLPSEHSPVLGPLNSHNVNNESCNDSHGLSNCLEGTGDPDATLCAEISILPKFCSTPVSPGCERKIKKKRRCPRKSLPITDLSTLDALNNKQAVIPGKGVKREAPFAAGAPGEIHPHKIRTPSQRSLAAFGFKLNPCAKAFPGSLLFATEGSMSNSLIAFSDSQIPSNMGSTTTNGSNETILDALKNMESRLEASADVRAANMKEEIILKVTEEAKLEIATQLDKYRAEDKLKWDALDKRLKELETAQTRNLTNPDEIKNEIKTQVTEALKSCTDGLIKDMEEKIARRMNKILVGLDFKERSEKKLNLIVQGYEGSPDFICQEARQLLCQKFQAEENIVNVTVSPSNDTACVTMKNWEAKLDILKRKKSVLEGLPIFISSDLTSREARIAKKLRDAAKKSKADGKKTRLGYNTQKIQIDQQWFDWDEMRECLVPVSIDFTQKKSRQRSQTTKPGNGKGSASKQRNQKSSSPSGTQMVLDA